MDLGFTRPARLGWCSGSLIRQIHISSTCGDESRKLAKNGTDSRKHSRMSCGLAERSRFVWLQPDWTGWRERGMLEDVELDWIRLACDSELLGGQDRLKAAT